MNAVETDMWLKNTKEIRANNLSGIYDFRYEMLIHFLSLHL